jgi:AraC-like DNA-binding protein
MGTIELAAVGLAGSGVGTAMAIPMVWPGSPRPADVRFMGGWLLAGSAVVALISARLIGLVPVTAADHAINLLGFCAYPCLYLSFNTNTQAMTLRVRRTWWLFAPAGVYLAVVLIRGASGQSTRVPFGWILPVLLAWTSVCAVTAFRYPKRYQPTLVPMRFLVAFLFVLNIAQIVRMQFGHVEPVRALVPLVMTGGFVTLVGLLIWRALDRAPAAREPAAARYERSGLDRESGMRLLAAVERTLERDRLFADPNLTLGRLAAAVGSTPHQVSEVLNRYASTTFHEAVNRHRVAEVKAQLRDPAADRFTIEGIGATAGFGSRSALYAAFRRLEGMTPTEFKARARPPAGPSPPVIRKGRPEPRW